MATLTIHRGLQKLEWTFQAPAPLRELLAAAEVSLAQPCGGRGVCGKCAVLLSGQVSEPSEAEKRLGVRLACQAQAEGDAEVVLPQAAGMMIEEGAGEAIPAVSPMPGTIGAAVDIGTTTLALRLYDLQTGSCLGASSMLNPQTSVAADVIGRMDAALKGGLASLREQVTGAVEAMLIAAAAQAGIAADQVASMVVTGNTTMLYLLTGRDPFSLSRAPFEADCLFGTETGLLGRRVYLPQCLHAFVGADVACAALACDLCGRDETALLMDVGTNGELALWHEGKLYIASTAAGPAFEGAGIRCGCGSIEGAIDQVQVVNGRLAAHTIGEKKAAGLCGSGLIDAVAALMDLEWMDETGLLDEDEIHLRDGVFIAQEDIRAVQLAKAAMAAGVSTLLSSAGCDESQVKRVCLAGGFGSHLNLRSAARIGLIAPELTRKVQVIGNGALMGAARLLMDQSLTAALKQMHAVSEHVRLDGNPVFSDLYISAMLFEEE